MIRCQMGRHLSPVDSEVTLKTLSRNAESANETNKDIQRNKYMAGSKPLKLVICPFLTDVTQSGAESSVLCVKPGATGGRLPLASHPARS